MTKRHFLQDTGTPARHGALGRTLIRSMVALMLTGAGCRLAAAELGYALQSPLLGGTNNALYQVESGRVSALRQKEAKAGAEAQAQKNAAQQAINNTPAARFATSLQSQMFLLVSQQLSQRISALQPGQAGTFQSGDILVSYTRSESAVDVQISTPAGTTQMLLPILGN